MEDRRLRLLQILHAVGTEAGDGVLRNSLAAEWMIRATRDQVRADLSWLEHLELVRTDELPGDVMVALITERGSEAVQGLVRIPGLRFPNPWEREG